MPELHVAETEAVTGPSGARYRLAPESAPPLERALANRDVTRAFLLDIIGAMQARYPPEVFPMQLVQALGEALRALPVSWLREFAYAGMLATLQGIEEGAERNAPSPGDGTANDEGGDIHGIA